MSIITLTTDYGHKDYFVGAIKGSIYSEFPEATIVDISHDIFPFNLAEASYIIKAAYKNFPDGTVHIIGIDIEKSKFNQHLVLFWQNQYFISANNGILSLLVAETNHKNIYEINLENNSDQSLTDILIFIKVACHLANNRNIEAIGTPFYDLKQITTLKATISEDEKTLLGMIVYIDNYGNTVTNISKEQFNYHAQQRSFVINFKNKVITTIFAKYSDFLIGKNENEALYHGTLMAVFNEAGFLEIAVYRSSPTAGSAKTMFGLTYGDTVAVKFI